MHELRCAEIWGGIRDEDQDACSAGLCASLYSSACAGGRGGDIYYFSVCGRDRLTRVAVADVAGHGPSVSDVSGWLYGALEAHMNDVDGGRLLGELNALATERGLRAMTTAVVVGYYLGDGVARVATAGHHPVLCQPRGGSWRSLAEQPDDGDDGPPADMPLGVLPDTRYPETATALASGDRLAVYTDGVLEAPDGGQRHFGLARLLETLDEHAALPLPALKGAVLDAVRRHTGGPLAHDDVTLLICEIR